MSALKAIASRAADKNLPFLLAGGHAVIVHGYPRNTFDIDLIVCRNDQAAWKELTAALGYNFYRGGPTFLQFNPPNPEMLPLDLMFVNEQTFSKLMDEAVPGPADSTEVKVVSLYHLLALKCHAIKHGHRARLVKDADDVIRLTQANRLDVNDPKIRELFLKHGTTELYEKTQRACGKS